MNSNEPARWAAVDAYLTEHLAPADDALTRALRDSAAAGLPAINVSATQGRLLNLLARIRGARTILEIGTLGGYSTIWLARALPADGRLVTLEASARHAEVATANLARAGLADRTEVVVGPALDSLPGLLDDPRAPFDLVFVDADKPNNPRYLEWALRLTRPGSVLVFDNVVRGGRVADAGDPDPAVRATRELIERLGAEPRLDATALQTVGDRHWDGLAVALVTA